MHGWKSKTKECPKEKCTSSIAKNKTERIYLDIATVKGEKNRPKVQKKKNWRIIVDECTQIKFSRFFKTKNGMIQPTLEQINKWKNKGLIVNFMQMDNSGENKKLNTGS